VITTAARRPLNGFSAQSQRSNRDSSGESVTGLVALATANATTIPLRCSVKQRCVALWQMASSVAACVLLNHPAGEGAENSVGPSDINILVSHWKTGANWSGAT